MLYKIAYKYSVLVYVIYTFYRVLHFFNFSDDIQFGYVFRGTLDRWPQVILLL